MQIFADVDIDVKDKNDLISKLGCIEATQSISENGLTKHNSGVYFQKVPTDPITGLCSIHYKKSEEMGYQKVDLLNNHAYELVRDRDHLRELVKREPIWEYLEIEEFVLELYHLHKNFNLVNKWKPKSITHIALLLAMIRPAKRHLLDCSSWEDVEAGGIWNNDNVSGYAIKKSHAFAYAHLIVVQMNSLIETLNDL